MGKGRISLFFWVLVLTVVTCQEQECPRRCICFFDTVRCMFQKLSHVPRAPTNTTVLDLRFNEITEIRPGVFHRFQNMHTLLLNDNRIRHLRKGAFTGLRNLRILYLYNNRISNIEPGAFDNLSKLEQLYLHYNDLRDIGKGTFNNLPHLERLMLHNNKLRHLPVDAFRNVGSMTRLRLDSNLLICDCDLMWLVERLQKSPAEVTADCQAPEEIKGRPLTAMTLEDFHCAKPKIMEGPEDVEVRLGETVTFVCRVSGDPRPEIKWMRDSNEVHADGIHHVMHEDGTLVILDITEEDVGEYECVAENEMGSTHSRKARALVTVSPMLRFAVLPQSQTVLVGHDVSFICRVEGQPAPIIEWWRDGFQMTTGGKMVLEDEGRILKISSVKESDAARYVCRGRNINGFTETSADLRVISEDREPPKLTYEPPNMETEVGMSIEIPCRAKGNPKPVIQWKKDGSAVEVGRVKISRGGSLFLYNVTVEDSGRYECTAFNEYGQTSAQALIVVKPLSSNDVLVIRAFREAAEEIDRAINKTLENFFHSNDTSNRIDRFRLSRFPDAIGRANARPAEIFERTLQNIRRLVRAGKEANVTDEFQYEELLTAEQVFEIEKLSGCTAHRRKDDCANMCYHQKYRTIDGMCNNLRNPTWGSSYTGFRRILQPIYENGFSQPVGWNKTRRYYGYKKPSARLVSTTLISTTDITSDDRITHMVMQWGQFLDHDLDHALPAVSSESWDGIDCKKSCTNAPPCFPMEVPPGDPRISNRRCIDFVRTSAVCGSGQTSILWGKLTPREQLNQLTSYLDASQVYGYDNDLARDLRDLTTNQGLLREGPTIPGHKPLLPFANGQFVDCRKNPLESSTNCFVTGDFRANEQVGLLAMHTVWLREHNRIARRLRQVNPHWSGEKLYQESRKIVGAEMQHITYKHWIPKVLGSSFDELVGSYKTYNPELDATISNVFATAALRFGHTLIQPKLERLDGEFRSIPQGALNLRDAFFAPWRLVDEGGVDPLMRGMFATPAKLKLPEQNLNSELTEQLFRTAHAVALDLAAMNIQRGRDHALPGYLEWRYHCNSSHISNFDDLADDIRNAHVRQKLRELYGHPGNMDVWVGGILEDQLPGAKVGPLFRCLLLEQFSRMRDGDRQWYENPSTFREEQLVQIKRATLARILCDNGDNITRIQKDVFLLPAEDNESVSCEEIPSLDLRMWSDCCEECSGDFRDNGESRTRRAAEKYSAEMNRASLRKEDYADKIREVSKEIRKLDKRMKQLEESFKHIKKQLEERK